MRVEVIYDGMYNMWFVDTVMGICRTQELESKSMNLCIKFAKELQQENMCQLLVFNEDYELKKLYKCK